MDPHNSIDQVKEMVIGLLNKIKNTLDSYLNIRLTSKEENYADSIRFSN
jgi:hypothetical protein